MNTTFLDTFKWTLVTYKDSYLKTFVGLIIAFAVAAALTSSFLTNIISDEYFTYKYSIASIWVFVSAVAFMIIASTTFSNMQDKHDRIWFMMLPAKKSHKFWARAIVSFILATAGSLVAMLGIDAIIMALQLLFHGHAESVTAVYFSIIKEVNEIKVYLIMGLMLMISYTTYMLGSVAFRKWAWLWTTIAWNILWAILLFIAGFLSDFINYKELFETLSNMNDDVLYYGFVTFLALIVGFNTWASYKLFARMQLITGKWLNV